MKILEKMGINTLLGVFAVLLLSLFGCGGEDENPKPNDEIQHPVTAAFTVDNQEVNIGIQLSFTNQSTGDISSYEWTFPNGTPASSADKNPVITYSQAGTYDVTLKVTSVDDTDAITKTGFITILANPTVEATFNWETDVVFEGETILFTSTTNTNVSEWKWLVDGEEVGTGGTYGIQFDEYGTYDISLMVSSSNSTDTETIEGLIHVLPGNMTAFYPMDGDMNDALNGHNATVFGQLAGSPNRNSLNDKSSSLYTNSAEFGEGYAFGKISDDELKTPTFTVSMWIEWSNQTAPYIGGNTGVHQQPILTTLNNSPSAYIEGLNLSIYQNKVTAVRYAQNGGKVTLAQAPNELPLASWTHVVASYTEDSTYLYLNGELVSQMYAGFPIEYRNTDADVVIGAYDYSVFDGRFNGVLDDMRIYDRKLDEEAVKLLYEFDSGN